MYKTSISLSIFALVFLSQIAFGQTKYKTYANARFGYQIQYPVRVLEPQEEAANGDGRVILSKDKTAEMRVWGQYNALLKTLRRSYQDALKGYGSDVTYKVLLSNGYVISGTKGNKIFYQKTLLNGDGRDAGAVYYTFTINYRKSDKAKFDPIVKRIAKSFKFN